MMNRILVTAGIVLYAVVVPVLEVKIPTCSTRPG